MENILTVQDLPYDQARALQDRILKDVPTGISVNLSYPGRNKTSGEDLPCSIEIYQVSTITFGDGIERGAISLSDVKERIETIVERVKKGS